MSTNSISNYVSSIYDSIPGKNKEEKASHVAERSFKTLPWVVLGALLHRFSPSSLRKYLSLSTLFANYIPVPILPRISLGMGVACELQNAHIYSKNVTRTKSWSHRLQFLALAYTALKWAYMYLKDLDKQGNDKAAQKNTGEKKDIDISPAVVIAVPFMIKYNPLASIVGLAFGFLTQSFKTGIVITLSKMNFQKLPKGLQPIAIMFRRIFAQFISNKYETLALPRTSTEICQTAWTVWDLFALSVGSRLNAMTGGAKQGQILFHLIMFLFASKNTMSNPPPAKK